jgi:hypothetical protein
VAAVALGVEASYVDPVRYSFAHGGKDGFPFPVNEADMENSYNILNRALRKSRTGRREQMQALKNLAKWHNESIRSNNITCTPKTNDLSNDIVCFQETIQEFTDDKSITQLRLF